jgi:hypothetical protein
MDSMDVPGPNISAIPLALSVGISSFGIIPPPKTNTSNNPCSLKSLTTSVK